MDSVSLDELIAKLKGELHKLGPLIDLEVARELPGSRTEGGLMQWPLARFRSGGPSSVTDRRL